MQSPNPLLPFRTQRLEPHIPFALAAFTFWAAVMLQASSESPWIAAVYAGCIGAWARAYPARRAGMLLFRSVLLLLAGLVLLASATQREASATWWIWPLAIVVGYGLLLPARPSAFLAALGFSIVAGGFAFATPGPGWQLALSLVAAQAALSWVAYVCGQALGEAESRSEATRVDARTQLFNEEGFFVHGGALFEECRRERKPFSLVLLSGTDLADATAVLGKRAANELFAQMVKGIAAATPQGGIAARTDAVEFAMAMPGYDVERAEAQVRQRLGRPAAVTIQMGGAKATIVLELLTAQAPSEIHTLEELYDRLHTRMREEAQPPADTQVTDRSTLHGLLYGDGPSLHEVKPTLPMRLAGGRAAP